MVTGKPTDVLLTALLDPNQAVESRYIGYNVTTRNGRELSGIQVRADRRMAWQFDECPSACGFDRELFGIAPVSSPTIAASAPPCP